MSDENVNLELGEFKTLIFLQLDKCKINSFNLALESKNENSVFKVTDNGR
jgi:hypothetical protein